VLAGPVQSLRAPLHALHSIHDCGPPTLCIEAHCYLQCDALPLFLLACIDAGGFGTLEELLEMVTWSQLGIHEKAVAVLNVEGFYDPLLQFFDQIVTQGFAGCEIKESILSSGSRESSLIWWLVTRRSIKQLCQKRAGTWATAV